MCLFSIHGLDKTMAKEERGTVTKFLPVQQKGIVLDTHPAPGEADCCRTDERQVSSAEWPHVWPGCVQSNLGTLLCGELGKKLVSILQRSSYLVWLVIQMARTRAGFRIVSCSGGQPCGVQAWMAVKFPQAWGWLKRHRPEPQATQESSWFSRSCPLEKDCRRGS